MNCRYAKTCAVVFVAMSGIFQISTNALQLTTPFNGCTFYKSRLVPESFASGKIAAGCANFSAKLGRKNCRKTKGFCPACITYKGDHIQMWLPDYFIEITKNIGRSAFAESIDSQILALQLGLAKQWWAYSTVSVVNPYVSNGAQSDVSRESFWHARILTVPYGSFANNFLPLAIAKGNGLPSCFSAISEFMPAQWDYNLSDSPYASALASIGIPLCLSNIGATA